MANGVPLATEDWEFAAANGERMQVHVKYQSAPANKGGGGSEVLQSVRSFQISNL
jgi:hypothetical protein